MYILLFPSGKQLNYIRSFFQLRCKVNVITKVGFGRGRLRRDRHPYLSTVPLAGFNYVLGIEGVDFDVAIPYENPEDFLTFKWFKYNVICRDQPWICGYEAAETSNGTNKMQRP